MAVPKKGSRIIVVDGRRYRWHVRRTPTYGQGLAQSPLSFGVELADQPAQVLHVKLDVARPDTWLATTAVTLSPAIVASIIRRAIIDGWRPDSPGPTFVAHSRVAEDPPEGEVGV